MLCASVCNQTADLHDPVLGHFLLAGCIRSAHVHHPAGQQKYAGLMLVYLIPKRPLLAESLPASQAASMLADTTELIWRRPVLTCWCRALVCTIAKCLGHQLTALAWLAWLPLPINAVL